MRHQPRRTATILTMLALLCVLLAAATTPVASAAPSPGAAARALAREQRVQQRQARRQQREAERQSREQAREARRAAQAAQRAARKAEHEELHAKRVAERAARSATQAGTPGTSSPEQPAKTEGSEGTKSGEGETHGGEGQTPRADTPRGTCAIAASATPTPAPTGEAVTLAGTLTCPTAAEAGEQTVTVYVHARGSGAGSSTIAGTATTAADGSFQFHTAALSVTSIFTLQTPTARHPGRVVVPVDAGVTLAGPLASGATLPMSASRQAGGAVTETFTGTIQPAQADRMVALEVRYGAGEWRKVAYTRTDAEGRFSFTHRFRFAGEVSVLASAHPLGTEQAESIPLTYTVAQAQNPAVTIALAPSLTAPSTAALAPSSTTGTGTGAGAGAGAAATISGVALDWANRTVTLLELGPDGRYTSVATALTDATGAYSFTVDPTATTVYRVACGTHRSAPVRLEVNPPSAAAPAS